MNAENLRREAEALQSELIAHRRFLHAHAETGFDLKETLPYVKKALEDLGYDPKPCGKAGLVALAGGHTPGRVFLLRADMDALSIPEESGEVFACPNGKMHACGHDLHTAMLLGAARLLKRHEAEIPGTIKLMFQPAEEIFEGSHDMIEHGLLTDPKPDAALMVHVMAGMPFPPGTVIVAPPGVSAPAADFFAITVRGKGCHGSMPNTGVDPLRTAAQILLALDEIRTRELAMSDQAVLTIGSFQAGSAANVIPDTAVMQGSLRTFDEETRASVKERITQIAQNVAAAFRADAKVTFGSGCPTLYNQEDLTACAGQYLKELLGPDRAFSAAELQAMRGGQGASKSAGSEDFSYVSQQVPSVMLALAAGQPDQGYAYPQHHPKVRFDESALPSGAAAYAYAALRYLQEHPL